MEHEPWLKDVLVFLAAASLVIPLFHRARIGAVLGFLLIGVVVGPHGLGLLTEHHWVRYLTIEDQKRVDLIAELGILALLFLIGLEFSFGRLTALKRYVFGVGGLQFFVSAAAIGAVVALAGVGAPTALVLGLALAMSSTALVMRLVEEQGRSGTPLGRIALAVLLFQDLMVAPALSLVGVLGKPGDQILWSLASALLQGVAAVAAIILLGRFVLQPLLRFTGATGSRDLIMAVTVLIVAGMAGLTHLAGVSTALGAFLAGVLLSETAYRHQIEVDLEPFKGLLLGVFFVSVGMTIDLRVVWAQLGPVLLGLAAVIVIKAGVLLLAARVFRVGLGLSAEVAILLSQAGEFAFILVNLARSGGVLPPELAQPALAVVGLSMVATPLLALAARKLGERYAQRDHPASMPALDQMEDHIVIGGFGRVGQTIARLLDQEEVAYLALDTDGELVNEHRASGRVFMGDASRVEFLDRAGVDRARAFVVTLNDPAAAERMVRAIRERRPDATVFARAIDATHAQKLAQLGAVEVIPETVEASLQLGARVLECVGIPESAVVSRIDKLRDDELGRIGGVPS